MSDQQKNLTVETAFYLIEAMPITTNFLAIGLKGGEKKRSKKASAHENIRNFNIDEVISFTTSYQTLKEVEVSDYLFLNNVYFEQQNFAFGVGENLVSRENFFEILKGIDFNSSSVEYGYVFSRPRHLGPDYFPIGVCYGLGHSLPEQMQASEISRWGSEAVYEKIWNEGKIREVFTWNLLNNCQLSRPIEGSTLRDWILSDFSNGSLTELSNGRAIWNVGPENVIRIRRQLIDAQIVFDWTRDLDGFEQHPAVLDFRQWRRDVDIVIG